MNNFFDSKSYQNVCMRNVRVKSPFTSLYTNFFYNGRDDLFVVKKCLYEEKVTERFKSTENTLKLESFVRGDVQDIKVVKERSSARERYLKNED